MDAYTIMCYKHSDKFTAIEIRYATETEVFDIANLLMKNKEYSFVAVINYTTDRIVKIIK